MKNSSLYKKMNIKNKIKDIAFICIIGYSVAACTNHKTATIEVDKVMDINTIDGYMDEVVDTVIYLPLEMTDNSALSRVQKIWADDSLYFLADFNYSKIVAYTHEGGQRIFQVGNPLIYQAYCVPLLHENRTVTPCHPPGCAYRQF